MKNPLYGRNWWIWAVVGAVAIWYLFIRNRSKQQLQSASGNIGSTGTLSTPPDAYWSGWSTAADTILSNTTNTVSAFTNSSKSLLAGISGFFGGASRATGTANAPQTNGSGAGVPIDYSTPNNYDWSPNDTSLWSAGN